MSCAFLLNISDYLKLSSQVTSFTNTYLALFVYFAVTGLPPASHNIKSRTTEAVSDDLCLCIKDKQTVLQNFLVTAYKTCLFCWSKGPHTKQLFTQLYAIRPCRVFLNNHSQLLNSPSADGWHLREPQIQSCQSEALLTQIRTLGKTETTRQENIDQKGRRSPLITWIWFEVAKPYTAIYRGGEHADSELRLGSGCSWQWSRED